MSAPERDTVTELTAEPPAPPAPPAPPRRFRLGHYLAMLTVLAIVGGTGWLIYKRLQKGYQFRAEVEAIMKPLGGNVPAEVEAIYDQASPRFKQTLILDKFVDLVDRMHETLGPYRRIVDVIQVDRMSTVAGQAVRVKLELEFERGRTKGELSFLRDERRNWVLLGLNIEIPPDLVAQAKALERQDKRLVAPDDVITGVERILGKLQRGQIAEIHGEAAPAFKTTVSAEAFADLTRGHAEELGGFVGLVKIITSAQNENKDRARVQTLLQYEKKRTIATFDFQQIENRWQLLHFKVEVPEPFSPQSGRAPDEDDDEARPAEPAPAAAP